MAFLVFEGLDGAGKTTLIKKLADALKAHNLRVVCTREPGGTPLGDELRKVLLRIDGDTPRPRTEILLYEAIRAQHVECLIQPALGRGDWVLCDRFTASSIAFQAGGRALKESEILWLNNFATNSLSADLTILLDLTVEESGNRMLRREQTTGVSHDRFENEKQDFHERVRAAYLRQAEADPDKWLIVDAKKTPDQIFEFTWNALRSRGWLNS